MSSRARELQLFGCHSHAGTGVYPIRQGDSCVCMKEHPPTEGALPMDGAVHPLYGRGVTSSTRCVTGPKVRGSVTIW